jgi:hypothetical protein
MNYEKTEEKMYNDNKTKNEFTVWMKRKIIIRCTLYLKNLTLTFMDLNNYFEKKYSRKMHNMINIIRHKKKFDFRMFHGT